MTYRRAGDRSPEARAQDLSTVDGPETSCLLTLNVHDSTSPHMAQRVRIRGAWRHVYSVVVGSHTARAGPA